MADKNGVDKDSIRKRIAALPPERRKLLEGLLKNEQVSQSLPILPRAKDRTDLPLSYAQQRLWFLDQLAPGNPFYNIPVVLPFNGNMEVLKRCLNEIVRRHEVLRTTFSYQDGQPNQVVTPTLQLEIPVINLEELPGDQQQARVSSLMSEEFQRPFDLARGPLIRGALLQFGPFRNIFLLTLHHIIFDKWSLDILFRELTTLYQHFLQGRPSPLPELTVQYADYALWQQAWLQGEVLEQQLNYWRRQLANLPVFELQPDRPRPMLQRFQGAVHEIRLSTSLVNRLRVLSQREGVTLYMTLLAAFKTLLYRYTGQADIVIGMPIAGRNRAELEVLIGFFVNSLVLRTDLSGNPTFRQVMQRVRKVALEAYNYQDLPFEKLVEELQPTRDTSRNPLFQITFQLLQVQGQSDRGLQAEDPVSSSLTKHRGTSLFDLACTLVESPDGISGGFEYDTDLFDSSTIERLSDCYQMLLESILANPDARIEELSILQTKELQQLAVWNTTSAHYSTQFCLHELFEQQVGRTPEVVAVCGDFGELSYQDLNSQANKLAHHLRSMGVQVGDLIAIFMKRSPEMVVGLLGILKAGAGYVPIDPAYPEARLAFMLQDARPAVLLTEKALLDQLPTSGVPTFCLNREWLQQDGQTSHNPGLEVAPENVAYVIYTSGSTGQPKGVMIPHRAIGNHMQWMQDTFPLSPHDRVIQRTPISFDASVWEFWAPILAGASLVLPDLETPTYTHDLVGAIKAYHGSVLQLVPSLLRFLLAEPEFVDCRSLKRVFCGGEALPSELQEGTSAMIGVDLINLYGPTEASIDATFYQSGGSSNRPFIPIGRPIANTQVYVLDQSLNLMPIGVPGELYISGAGLAHGYLHRPGLTAERFIPDPFSAEPGARMYRTGDLVLYLPDGNLEFLGRTDYQVKLRGFRIELGEIEAVLSQHPSVKQAVVILREDSPGDERLVAYVIPKEAELLVTSELRKYLQERLPEYMIPGGFTALAELPLTPNGKIDRRSLPAPDATRPELDADYAPPSSELEEQLVDIWSEILHLEKVGIHDNFFALGGHSLLAMQLVSRIRNTFDIEFPLRYIFESPTIENQALTIEQILIAEIEALSDTEAERLAQGEL